MTPVSHLDRVVRFRLDATTRRNLTDARCKALFASGLQRSDARPPQWPQRPSRAPCSGSPPVAASAGRHKSSATTPTRPPSACAGSASSPPRCPPDRRSTLCRATSRARHEIAVSPGSDCTRSMDAGEEAHPTRKAGRQPQATPAPAPKPWTSRPGCSATTSNGTRPGSPPPSPADRS